MDILYLLIPLSALLVLAILGVFALGAARAASSTTWNATASRFSAPATRRLMRDQGP